jgi:hypothetical protein
MSQSRDSAREQRNGGREGGAGGRYTTSGEVSRPEMKGGSKGSPRSAQQW